MVAVRLSASRCATVQLDTPIARALPHRSASSIARHVSARSAGIAPSSIPSAA